jgi:cbb3-type cytochrome oxidase subunit 3
MIPRQEVLVNDTPFYTDSIRVEVADVVVDTTQQKLYPIKPSVAVSSGFTMPAWAWWLLAFIAIALIVYFFFRRKKKKQAEAQKLPPYEQAIFELKKLDDSHLLEQREIKEYYSQLSLAVRKYLDEEVYDRALESTTGELILYLETQKNAGNLKIDDEYIEKLKKILQRADPVDRLDLIPVEIKAGEFL